MKQAAFAFVVLLLLSPPVPGLCAPAGQVANQRQYKVAPTVPVPNLKGRSLADAEQLLRGAGLVLKDQKRVQSDEAPGTVLDQNPPPDTPVRPGTQVSVTVAVARVTIPGLQARVAVPPRLTAVPKLQGRSLADAEQLLRGAELILGDQRRVASDEPPGTVIDQSPMPDARVQRGTRVSVIVAIARSVAPNQGGKSRAPVQFVIVPDLKGRSLEEAQQIASRAGLVLGDLTRRESDQPAGTVVDQNPQAGDRVRPRSTLFLTIAVARTIPPVQQPPARPAQLVPVPELKGGLLREAQQRLKRGGLSLGNQTSVPSDQPPGTVIDQTPSAGEWVRPRTRVSVYVAVAPVLSLVPDLRAQFVQDAQSLLGSRRLLLGEQTNVESDRPPGSIVDQNPAPGAQVRPRTKVNVSIAVAPVVTVVPNLRGQSVRNAQALLDSYSLVLGDRTAVESDQAPGTIIDQSPRPGAQVKPSAAINVTLAAAPTLTTVPNLKGRSLQDAEVLLQNARLVLGPQTNVRSERRPGTVLDQRPQPGSRLPAGSTVEVDTAVRLEAGVALLAVPNVTGRSFDEARGLVERAGLTVGTRTEQPARQSAGTIVSQSPVAGTRVSRGTPVNVSVASSRVAVPDITGRDAETARSLLAEARLVLGDVRRESSRRPAGLILGQEPAAGTLVTPGQKVSIRVAEPFTVPGWLIAVALGAAAGLAAVYKRVIRAARKWSNKKASETSPPEPPQPGTLNYRVTKDDGTQEIERDRDVQEDAGLRFVTVLDIGTQTVEAEPEAKQEAQL